MRKNPFAELRALGVTMSLAERSALPPAPKRRGKATPKAVIAAVRDALQRYQGLSAASIACVLVPELRDYADGLTGGYGLGSHPCDPDDFSRCRRIVELVPNGVARLGEVAAAFPKVRAWTQLAAAWPELEAAFIAEEARGWKPPYAMYGRMQELTR